MRKKFNVILPLTLYFFWSSNIFAAQNSIIHICGTDIQDAPFWYLDKENHISGSIVETIVKAEKKLTPNFQFKLTMLPWQRCLDELKKGQMDAAIAAPYRKDYAVYFIYPSGAENEKTPCSSPFRFYCSTYKVLTPKNLNLTYDGKLSSLPTPIRVVRGSLSADDFNESKTTVENAKDEDVITKQLIRDQTGCSIVSNSYSKKIAESENYKKHIQEQKTPFSVKSYYILFSKKTLISKENIRAIYNAFVDEKKIDR